MMEKKWINLNIIGTFLTLNTVLNVDHRESRTVPDHKVRNNFNICKWYKNGNSD